MKTQTGKSGDNWATANDLHEKKGTTRSWLRELWKAGKVRRRTIMAHGQNGELKTKYLYSVEDVERELSKTERKEADMSHPCDRYSCPEWNQGQCFGGGCKLNPAPDNTQTNNTEDKDNG